MRTGNNSNFEIRREELYMEIPGSFSIVYLSDLHLRGNSLSLIHAIIDAIDHLDPSIVLLGGDYVDTKKGLNFFDLLLQHIGKRPHVYAIAGNHDHFFGIEKIREMIIGNNIGWLEKQSLEFTLNGTRIKIDGNSFHKTKNKADVSILCLHKPIDIRKQAHHYNLALAGHLHGCQVVFWEHNNNLYPGKLLYRNNFLKKDVHSCKYLVSKGLGDTIPFRFNCKKDMMFVSITGIKKENT